MTNYILKMTMSATHTKRFQFQNSSKSTNLKLQSHNTCQQLLLLSRFIQQCIFGFWADKTLHTVNARVGMSRVAEWEAEVHWLSWKGVSAKDLRLLVVYSFALQQDKMLSSHSWNMFNFFIVTKNKRPYSPPASVVHCPLLRYFFPRYSKFLCCRLSLFLFIEQYLTGLLTMFCMLADM